MIINLFDKGKGLDYLQDIYSLTNKQIESIKRKIYKEQKYEPISEITLQSISQCIRLICDDEQENEKVIQYWRGHHPPTWEIADDAIEIFLQETGIYLDDYQLDDILLHCIHVSSAIDGGESIKKYGLRRLLELLETPSPIRDFLLKRGIEIKVNGHIILIQGKEHSLEHTALEQKLYPNCEVEACIAGELETVKEYSCVQDNPEFLREIEYISGIELQNEWKAQKNSLLYVSFDISFDECSNITDMCKLENVCNFERIIPFLRDKYQFGKEPKHIWRNFWLIDACIENCCPGRIVDRSPMAVKNNIVLGPERIKVGLYPE